MTFRIWKNVSNNWSREKAAAVNTQDFEGAAKIRDEEKQLRERLEQEKEVWKEKK